MSPAPTCTAEIIRKWGTEAPDDTALVFEGATTTWRELDQRSSRLANAFAAAGVGAQDRVVFIDKNGPAYFEVTFGLAKLNAVMVAANWRLAPPELAYTINDSQAKVVIVGPDFIPLIEQIARELTAVTKIIVHACVFAVRRAWVPTSVERSQSQKPVRAASTDTAAPPMKRKVPARKKSRL